MMVFIVSYEIKVFSSIDELIVYFAELLKKEVNTSGHRYNLALSGGTTPKIIFNYLADNYLTKIDWNKINFFWGDERCVPPFDEDSNYKMAFDNLLGKLDLSSENIFRIFGEAVPEEESTRYGEIIKKSVSLVKDFPQFDLVMLGLGEDGHTASIFPNQINFINSDAICAVANHPSNNQKRITVTGRVINNAKNIVFIVTGEKKSKVVYDIIGDKNNSIKYPASFINPVDGKLIWILDESAAKLL